VIYLASPYSHPWPELRQARFLAAKNVVSKLMSAGKVVFSPIVYSHQFASEHGTDFRSWAKFNLEMLNLADELIVLMIDGWELSEGVWTEVEHAKEIGKPVGYLNPQTMEVRP